MRHLRPTCLVYVCTLFALSSLLSGCLSVKLKKLEISQLKADIESIDDASQFFSTKPTLDVSYGAEAFVGGAAFNRFLAGLDNYVIPLQTPSGAAITVKSTRLVFQDGAPEADIDAVAADKTNTIVIKLRVRADLLLKADPTNHQLVVGFEVKEVLPDIKLSIFRWREFWFAAAIMRLEAQKYIDALPAVVIPLSPNLPIDLPGSSQSASGTPAGGTITYLINLPSVHLAYTYNVLKAVTLKDGVHVFFTLN